MNCTWNEFCHHCMDMCMTKNEEIINDPEIIEYVYTFDYDYDLLELTCTIAGSFKANSINLSKEEFEASNLTYEILLGRLIDQIKFTQ